MFDEILLEKLAAGYDEEDLELLMEEAAMEAEKSAHDLDADDIEKLAEYLGEDEVAALLAEVEAEKTASEYYEMGQVMAQGFNDELEKGAGAGAVLRALDPRRGWRAAKSLGRKMKAGYESGRSLSSGGASKLKKMVDSGRLSGSRLERAKAMLRSGKQGIGYGASGAAKVLKSKKMLAGRAALGLGSGAAMAGGAGYAAHKGLQAAYGKEKKSSDEEVYNAIALLDAHGLLDE